MNVSKRRIDGGDGEEEEEEDDDNDNDERIKFKLIIIDDRVACIV